MNLKSILIGVFVIYVNVISYSQTTLEQRKPAGEKAIPKIVLDTFKKQYPGVFVKSWYVTHITYWYNDISSNWYYDWYGPRKIVIYPYEKPNFFEVEFVDEPGELSRAIYNRYAYWYETRTQLSGLPKVIVESLKQSKYADWKRSNLIEKIESAEWPESVYRFKVSKGIQANIIRMNIKGEIIQDKQISE